MSERVSERIPIDVGRRLRPPNADIVALVSIGLVQATMLIASVLVLRRMVDLLVGGARVGELVNLALWFCGAGVGLAAARALEYTMAERIGYRLVASVRMLLYSHLLELPARSVVRSSQGAVLLRFTGDLSTYRTWISRGLSRGVVSACTLLGGLIVLVVIDWVIALAVMAMLLLGAAVSALWGYRVRRTTRAVRWRRSLLASNVAEQIRGVAVVQAYGRTRGETSRLQGQNDDLLAALNRAALARGVLRLLSSATGSLAVGVVLVVGILEIERQQTSLGGVLAAMTAVRFLSGPVRTLGRSHEYWQAAQVSRRKLQDFLDRPKRAGDQTELERLRVGKGRIEFRGTTVSGGLNRLDLEIEPGELVAIVGENGAGKSTMLSVVARLIEPDAGQVAIDDQVLGDHTLASTARNVGIVSNDLPLMRGSIRRNLTYRYRNATEEMLRQVVLDCRVDEVLRSVDGGLSSWLVEGGANLSAGQRQRIMLARAILGNPRILLLDEPTTNLDPATKEVFRRVISRYRGTILLATHDPSEIALCDRVCFMESGRIVRSLSGDDYRSESSGERRVRAGRPQW